MHEMPNAMEQYLEAARHSLVYNEDFGPADWYFSPEVSEHCWGLLSKTVGSAEISVGFVPVYPGMDEKHVIRRLASEFRERFSRSRGTARLILVAVAEDMPDSRLGELVGHLVDAKAIVSVVAVDVSQSRLLSPAGFSESQPGAKSIGFRERDARPAEVEVLDERREAAKARRYFRDRMRRAQAANPFAVSHVEPRVTHALIAANVIVALIGLMIGGNTLIYMMAKFTPLIRAGQWWRVFSYQFVHANLMHIAFNMIALYNLGPLVEHAFGRAGFLCIYLLSGAVGGLASAAFAPLSLSVGASGSIFGLLGATALFLLSGRMSKDVLWRAVGYPIVATVIYGFVIRLDQLAHFGGLIAGFLLATIVGLGYRTPQQHRVMAAAALLFSVFVLVWIVFV